MTNRPIVIASKAKITKLSNTKHQCDGCRKTIYTTDEWTRYDPLFYCEDCYKRLYADKDVVLHWNKSTIDNIKQLTGLSEAEIKKMGKKILSSKS